MGTVNNVSLLHKRFTEQEWNNHTLNEGEIGFRVVKDSSGNITSIVETRIGIRQNCPWNDATPIMSAGGYVPISTQRGDYNASVVVANNAQNITIKTEDVMNYKHGSIETTLSSVALQVHDSYNSSHNNEISISQNGIKYKIHNNEHELPDGDIVTTSRTIAGLSLANNITATTLVSSLPTVTSTTNGVCPPPRGVATFNSGEYVFAATNASATPTWKKLTAGSGASPEWTTTMPTTVLLARLNGTAYVGSCTVTLTNAIVAVDTSGLFYGSGIIRDSADGRLVFWRIEYNTLYACHYDDYADESGPINDFTVEYLGY